MAWKKNMTVEEAAQVIERFLERRSSYPQEWNDFVENRQTDKDVEPFRKRCYDLDPLVNSHHPQDEDAIAELRTIVVEMRQEPRRNRMPERTIKIEIKRQSGPDAAAHWDKFEIPYRPGMNVISSMMEIAANPVTADGKSTTPIAYDSNCLEEICGSCAMLINGKAKMACSALIDNLEQPVRLEPLSKFPVVRDLAVDRSVLFENLKRVKAWVPVDGTYDLGPGPRIFPQSQEESYPLSNCISCTICMEVCPQFNVATGFVGAATIAQVKLFNENPTGKVLKEDRLRALMGDGGIADCAYAQNCVNACPKGLPLTRAISDVSRDVIVQSVKDFFTR